MASPLRIQRAPIRHCRDLGYAAAAVTCKPASTGESAAAVSLSQDVIFEILSWLPLKSLCRSWCVSKEWRTVISNPAFVAAHKSRAEPFLIAIVRSTSGTRALHLMDTEGTVVRVEELSRFWRFQASLGDLVCFSSGYHNSGTLVMDLATGKTLLDCAEPVSATPMYYYRCFGFGRAAQSGSLKVFRLVLPRKGQQICEVLTVGEGAKWRQTQSPPMMVCYSHMCCSAATVNGALHFIPEKHCDDVLSFDLDSENWKVIHGPRGIASGKVISTAELNGTLCVARTAEHVIDIWLLSDSNKNIWIKAYTMPMDPVHGYVVPLRVLRPGGELLFYYYESVPKPMLLQVYDPRSGKYTGIKTPAYRVGEIGLCSSNLDPKFCGLR